MADRHKKIIIWDFISIVIIVNFSILQVMRWRILPQFMDIYYHILTARGFLQAGGYSGWDFWQYAPVGRVHIYPPLVHIILSLFIKLGVNAVILAKILETVMPVAFLITAWHFIRKHYGERLAFFVILVTGSSLSFYMSLINHIPATAAAILGLLALDGLLKKRLLRPAILLSLCFYTHMGMSYFFGLCVILFGLFDRESRKLYLTVFASAVILSAPILFKQLASMKYISYLGLNLEEKNLCQFKIIEYVFAFFGLFIALRLFKKYRLFLSLFLVSFIFLVYPYRFFSAEGYLPVIFLSAVTLDTLWGWLRNRHVYLKYGIAWIIFLIFIISPTILMERDAGRIRYKLSIGHSAFLGTVFPMHKSYSSFVSVWFPDEYLSAAGLIKQNSAPDEIIYSSINMLGVTFAGISGRATSNALFPEINASQSFDPLSVSRIIIIAKDENPYWAGNIIGKYKLVKTGESRLFVFYKNPFSSGKVNVKKASVSFTVIAAIILTSIILLCLVIYNPGRFPAQARVRFPVQRGKRL